MSLDGPAPTTTIRVMIVDDHEMVAEGLRRSLEREAGIDIVAIAGDAAAAVVAARETRPDVVLMDLVLPGADGVEAARLLLAQRPNTRIVLLTGMAGRSAVHDAISAGCVGYLEKQASTPDLIAAVRRAHAGELVLAADDLQQLLASRAAPSTERLTDRETEVLRLLDDGLSNRAIAERLVISIDTVRTHVQRVLTKLDAHSRLEAVAEARRRQMLS